MDILPKRSLDQRLKIREDYQAKYKKVTSRFAILVDIDSEREVPWNNFDQIAREFRLCYPWGIYIFISIVLKITMFWDRIWKMTLEGSWTVIRDLWSMLWRHWWCHRERMTLTLFAKLWKDLEQMKQIWTKSLSQRTSRYHELGLTIYQLITIFTSGIEHYASCIWQRCAPKQKE